MQKKNKPDPPAAPPPKEKAESDKGWVSSEDMKGGKNRDHGWPTTLEDMFLFDPNFESCW